MDIGLTTPLTSTKIIDETKLYGKYYTVIIATLNVNGGNELVEKEMVIGCDGVYGKLPASTRTAHTFSGWFVKRIGEKKIEAGDINTIFNNHILYAHTGPSTNTLSPSSLATELNPKLHIGPFDKLQQKRQTLNCPSCT